MTPLPAREQRPAHLRESCAARRASVDALQAAREVTALLGGNVGRWTLDGIPISDAAASALLSLHDYLNDVERDT